MHNFFYTGRDENVIVSYEKQTPPHDMPSNHFHDAYELYYLLSGERYYFIADRTYRISEGSLVFIKKYELHRTIDSNIPSWERILINFKPEFLLSCDKSRIERLVTLFNADRRVILFQPSERKTVEDLLFKMTMEASSAKTNFEELLTAYLLQLLVFCKRYVEQNPAAEDTSVYSIYKKAASIVTYINSNYMDPLSLNMLAEKFYLSPYYICKIFKESTGFTFIEYLNKMRVKEAQKLLRMKGSTVLGISEKVGFGSVSNFGRIFKEISGVSPLNFRKLEE